MLQRLNAVASPIHGQARALSGYGVALVTYATGVGLSSLAARRAGRSPAPLAPLELTCLALATHKISRIVATDDVTRPLRAPFTRLITTDLSDEDPEEKPEDGAGHAVGELLTCPFCLGPWMAATLMVGHTFLPRLTRAGVSAFAAVAIADFLHVGYSAAQQRTEPAEPPAA